MSFGFDRQRWMPVLMQAFLWVVLLAAVGAAAMVDVTLRRWMAVQLTNPIADGRMAFRLPQHWKLTDRALGNAGMQHLASDITAAASGRKVFISRQKLGAVVLPVQYLLATGQIDADYELEPGVQSIDGWPAQVVNVTKPIDTAQGRIDFYSRIACLVLPTGEAVELCMEKPGAWDAADNQIFTQIADGMDIIGLADPKNESARLSNGGIVPCPRDGVLYGQADPLTTARQMVWQAGGGKWITIDLIPVAKTRQQSLAALNWALARLELADADADSAVAWLTAKVSSDGAGRWRIDPAQGAEEIVHRRGFLALDASGQGVLVRMVATLVTTPEEMLSVWQTISKGLGFDKPVNVDLLLDAGDIALDEIGPAAPANVSWWWLWSTNGVPSGWTHQVPDLNTATQQRGTVRRQWNDWPVKVTQTWGVDADSGVPICRADGADHNGRLFSAETRVRGRVLIAAGLRLGNGPIWTTETPATAFVPGNRLPELLALLPNRPLAFLTERVPGYEADPQNVPVLVLATPINTSPQTRPMEANALAWQVEAVGTGQISRWYFRPGGALDHGELADGQRVQPATLAQIQAAVGNDPRLTPALP